jgi:hypothetical protein
MAKSNPKPQGKQRRMRTERTGRTLENFKDRQMRRAEHLLRAADRRARNTFGITKAGNPRKATHAQIERREEAAGKINAKRATRLRLRNMKPLDRRIAREEGLRQFGPRAKGYHVHQRQNRLARALTPTEFKAAEEQERQRAQVEKATQRRAVVETG